MSIYTKYKWPIIDKQAVCLKQSRTGAGALLLNGTLANTSIPNQISFIGNNITRSISITAESNLSGINFIIQGLQNGAFVEETVAGPNGSADSPVTVYPNTYSYDIIYSVKTSDTVADVQIGTGTIGYLPLIVLNTNATIINYSYSILLPSSSAVNYSLYQTLDSINTNFIAFKDQTLFPVVTGSTTSSITNSTAMTNFLLFKINSSNPTDTFDFIFLQE